MNYFSLIALCLVLSSCSDDKEQVSTDPYIGQYTLSDHECNPINLFSFHDQNISVEYQSENNSENYKISGFFAEEVLLNENMEFNSPLAQYTFVNVKLVQNQITINTEILNINSYESCEYIYVK